VGKINGGAGLRGAAAWVADVRVALDLGELITRE